MKNRIKSLIDTFIALILVFGCSQGVHAMQVASVDTCENPKVSFLFFNGVNTSEAKAYFSLSKLEGIYGASPSDATIQFETLYNYSNGFADFVETFSQRLDVENGLLKGRYELFFPSLRNSGGFLDTILQAVTGVVGIFDPVRGKPCRSRAGSRARTA